MIENTNLTFRNFQGEADYPLMHSILVESAKADHIVENASIDDIRMWCAPSSRFNPHKDISIALDQRKDKEYTHIGFSRMGWYTGKENARLYYQDSFLIPQGRIQGIWPVIIVENERRLLEIAASHPHTPKRFFQSWATESQKEWISALESEGYSAVRHFNNMVRQLDNIPDRELPAGLAVRPVQKDHFRSIWDAQKEVQTELFELVAENWTDEKYENWLVNPTHTPDLWQVAWDGDQVAGMVLTRINEAENQALGRKRGYTEHIFVRRPWRQRGLASALIVRSLLSLKTRGMEEAELGVDTENESGAFGFYKRLGYQTYSIDIWFRKPVDLKTEVPNF